MRTSRIISGRNFSETGWNRMPPAKGNRMKRKYLGVCALAFGIGAGAFVVAQAAPASDVPVAKQGYLFAGGKYSSVNGKRVMAGQIYAEFQIPKNQKPHWLNP